MSQLADSISEAIDATTNNAEVIDRELESVRAVLTELATRRQLPDGFCWCEKPKWDSLQPHEARCLAAQELYQSLRKDTDGQ